MAQNTEARNIGWEDHPNFKEYQDTVSELSERCEKCGYSDNLYTSPFDDSGDKTLYCSECDSPTEYDLISFTEWCDLKGIEY